MQPGPLRSALQQGKAEQGGQALGHTTTGEKKLGREGRAWACLLGSGVRGRRCAGKRTNEGSKSNHTAGEHTAGEHTAGDEEARKP